MKLPNTAHTSQPWRIQEITQDFRLYDVWALPTPGRTTSPAWSGRPPQATRQTTRPTQAEPGVKGGMYGRRQRCLSCGRATDSARAVWE